MVDMVRSELLEDDTVTDEVAALTALLDKSGCLKEYFSKFEQKEIKQRLKEIAASPNGRLVGDGGACLQHDCHHDGPHHHDALRFPWQGREAWRSSARRSM